MQVYLVSYTKTFIEVPTNFSQATLVRIVKTRGEKGHWDNHASIWKLKQQQPCKYHFLRQSLGRTSTASLSNFIEVLIVKILRYKSLISHWDQYFESKEELVTSRPKAHPPQHWSWCRQTLPCPANVLVFVLSNHWWASNSWSPCKDGGPRGRELLDLTLVARRSPSCFFTRVLAPSVVLSFVDYHSNILMLQHGIHHQSWQKWASKHLKCDLSSQLTIIVGLVLPWDFIGVE